MPRRHLAGRVDRDRRTRLAKPGAAVDMIRKGDTSYGGRLPVNTSIGASKATGHRSAAAVSTQIVEDTRATPRPLWRAFRSMAHTDRLERTRAATWDDRAGEWLS